MSDASKGTSSELPSNQFGAAALSACTCSRDFSKGDVGDSRGKLVSSESLQMSQSFGRAPSNPVAYTTSTNVDTGLQETHPVYEDYVEYLQFMSAGSGDFLHHATETKATNEVPSLSNDHPCMEGNHELATRSPIVRTAEALQSSRSEDGVGLVADGQELPSQTAVTEDVDKAQELAVALEAWKGRLPLSHGSRASDGSSSSSSAGWQDLTIFVGNLPDQANWWSLRDFFAKFGPVKYCKIPRKFGPRQKRHAFVEFSTEEGYNKALNARDDQLIYRDWLLRVDKRERKNARQDRPVKTELAPEAEEQSLPNDSSKKLNELDSLTLSIIFSHLPLDDLARSERVCKQWQSLIRAEWKNRTCITFEGVLRKPLQCVTDRMLNSVLWKCGGNVKFLDLTYNPGFSRDVLKIVMKHCPLLVKVHLPGGITFSTKTAQKFAESCKHLEWLDLSGKAVSEKGLWYILHHCKKLRYLDVGRCKSVSGKCFYMLGNEFKTMKLTNCEMVVDYALDKIVEKCPDIQELDISGCWSLTHAGLTRLFKSLRSLQVLAAEDFLWGTMEHTDITSQTWSEIRHLKSLMALHLSNNRFLTDEVLTSIACSCTKLRELRISNLEGQDHLTDSGISSLVHLADLQDLDVSGQAKLTDAGVMMVIKQSKLQNFKAIRCELTDATGVCLAASCPALRLVDLRDNEKVTVKSLEAFVQHRKNDPNLKPSGLRLYLGGTDILRTSVEHLKLPDHIYLNTVPHSAFWPGSLMPTFDYGQFDSEEDEETVNKASGGIPAGMEDYDEDVFDSEMMNFGVEDDFFENDDPVLWDYFNPS